MRIDLNFASREYILLRKLYMALGVSLVAACAVLVLLFGLHRRDISRLERLGAEAARQQQSLGEERKTLAEYERNIDKKMITATYKEVAFANSVIDRRTFSWTLFLNRIEALVPDGVGITGIKPDFESLNVDIAGTAKNMDMVTSFIERLTGSKYFGDVPPVFSTSEAKVPGESGKTQQKFNIKIQYIPNPGQPAQGKATGEEG